MHGVRLFLGTSAPICYCVLIAAPRKDLLGTGRFACCRDAGR